MKKLGIALGVLVAIVLILGLVAPKDFSVEREVTIAQPKAVVFSYLKSLKNGAEWNPWAKKDPGIVHEYRGTDGTVGSVVAWSGNQEVGVGEQEIKNIVEGDRIDFELRFKKPWEGTNTAYLTTESAGDNQTKVRWGMAGKTSFPFNVVCLLMNLGKRVEKDFDEGLNNLKRILESK
jgi:uncharacterized protein YndB with AHSA1/START domain